MATSGSTPAASAWMPWARPISCPDGVTTEFSAMFWPLKGATRTPRRARRRHSPATIVVLPASEVVPQTISAPRIVSDEGPERAAAPVKVPPGGPGSCCQAHRVTSPSVDRFGSRRRCPGSRIGAHPRPSNPDEAVTMV